MTPVEWFLLSLILVAGFYAAWNIGANDVANAMGTSVGSGALTLRRAVILASIFEFAGAVLVGSNVSETVRKKMFEPELLNTLYGDQAAMILACGMLASLIAAGTWLLIATWAHWPVSTTHSIVGAVVGFGVVALGIEGIAWGKVGVITLGWVISPLLSGAVAYLLFSAILRMVFYKRDPVRAARKVTPYLVFTVLVVLCGVTAFKGLEPLWGRWDIDPFSPWGLLIVAGVAAALGLAGALIARYILERSAKRAQPLAPMYNPEVSRSLAKALMHLRRVRASTEGSAQQEVETLLENIERLQRESRKHSEMAAHSEQLRHVEKIFVILQVLTACMVAFAHGANDVANAIGPLSAAVQAIATGEIESKSAIPLWALALGGSGIVVGLATWGWRVIRTVGLRITELTPSRGFTAEFSAALTILLASVLPLGLPVSTTHTLVGAVLGVGLARGISALNVKTIRDIVAAWAITIPAGAGLSVAFFFLLKLIFIDSGWTG